MHTPMHTEPGRFWFDTAPIGPSPPCTCSHTPISMVSDTAARLTAARARHVDGRAARPPTLAWGSEREPHMQTCLRESWWFAAETARRERGGGGLLRVSSLATCGELARYGSGSDIDLDIDVRMLSHASSLKIVLKSSFSKDVESGSASSTSESLVSEVRTLSMVADTSGKICAAGVTFVRLVGMVSPEASIMVLTSISLPKRPFLPRARFRA